MATSITALGMFSVLVTGTAVILAVVGGGITLAIEPMVVAIGVIAALAYSFKTMGEGMNLATTGLQNCSKLLL